MENNNQMNLSVFKRRNRHLYTSSTIKFKPRETFRFLFGQLFLCPYFVLLILLLSFLFCFENLQNFEFLFHLIIPLVILPENHNTFKSNRISQISIQDNLSEYQIISQTYKIIRNIRMCITNHTIIIDKYRLNSYFSHTIRKGKCILMRMKIEYNE